MDKKQLVDEFCINILYLADSWLEDGIPCDAVVTGYICKRFQNNVADLI